MPAGDVFGLDGFFLNVSNPVTVSAVDINSTAAGAGITVVSGVLNATAGIATLTLSTAAGLSTTPFYTGAKIAVSGLSTAGAAYTGYNGNFVVTGFAGTTTVSYATTDYVGPVTAGITTTGLVMLVTDTAVTNTTWSSAQTHGWFGGGFNPSAPTTKSTVERIDFSNDTGTANIRGSLSSGRSDPAATGNSNYGWFGGGSLATSPFSTSTVDRIDFSNDSPSVSIRGPLSSTRYRLAAAANSNYGWFGGGIGGLFVTERSTVDRIDFSNDSASASPRGPLSLARTFLASTGNSNYGWFAGGGGGGPLVAVATVDRIDFANDSSVASVRGGLSSLRALLAATGNSNYGYFGGGGPAPQRSTVDRIDFSNDSATVSVRGPLSSARQTLAATGNSNYGWFGGGANPSPDIATVDRINFSNDSVTASIRGPLSVGRVFFAATSGQARSSSVRLQKAGNFGWFGGGQGGSPVVALATVDRINFSNDSTTASVRGSLSSPAGRYALASTGNSNYGWFAGGLIPPGTPVATVDRIDFSNDSPAGALSRGSLSVARYYAAATGNSNYGWFGGGLFPSRNTVDRINFSNDSTTASPRGVLSASRYQFTATGNSNYGWFAGGLLPVTARVDRIDFSNDSPSASIRGPLSAAKYNSAAIGNSNYGWFCGGNASVTVDRINFANDSVITSIRGPLSVFRGLGAATGNSNYGWFGGGKGGSPLAVFQTVDRIDFSNDAVTASSRGLLSGARYYLAATSNTPT